MEYGIFFASLLEDFHCYLLSYLFFLITYLLAYKKYIWGIFDPLFLEVVWMAGGAFCVYVLAYRHLIDDKYLYSFISTEIAFFFGMSTANYLPAVKITNNNLRLPLSQKNFEVSLYTVSITYLITELIAVLTIGVALFRDEVNHVSIYQDHGVLNSFVHALRFILIVSLFYKKISLKKKLNTFNVICLLVVFLACATSGSKASILIFFSIYFLLAFSLINKGERKKNSFSPILILIILCFPVLVIVIKENVSIVAATVILYGRFIASGDIFVLGYDDGVMKHIQETSFFKYLFYPGFGTIFKNLGFNIEPPSVIGADIYEYYYNNRNGGPNTRHNYLGMYFLGMGGVFLSFAIGLLIGYSRSIYKRMSLQADYFKQCLFVIFIYYVSTLITDVNIFMNYSFWTMLIFLVVFCLSRLICIFLKLGIS